MDIILGIMVCLSITTLVYGVSASMRSASIVKSRLASLSTLDEGLSLEEVELSKPFRERVIIPILTKLGGVLGRYTPNGIVTKASAKLAQAGYQWVNPATYLGVKAVVTLGLFVIASMTAFLSHMEMKMFLLYAVGFPGLGFLLPDVWLGMLAGKRKGLIRSALPDLLDLLTVSVEAGLGFDQALIKASEKMNGALIEEIKRTLQEMRIGKSRAEALRSLAERVNLPDLTSFTAALIQADQLGVSIATVLRVQSDTMRTKRRQVAEEAAMKAPLKLLFPLVLFIFPTIFVILLGPAVINIIENLRVN